MYDKIYLKLDKRLYYTIYYLHLIIVKNIKISRL